MEKKMPKSAERNADRKPMARNRVGGPSVVMRVPQKMEEMILSFVDVFADFQNQEIFGESKQLPPSKTTDMQRKKLCIIMEKMVHFETDRQLKHQQSESDKRQLNLFGQSECGVEQKHEAVSVSHLLTVNERLYAYIDSLYVLGYACWAKMSKNICVGDTVFLVVRGKDGSMLFETVVESVGPMDDSFTGFCKLSYIPEGEVYRLAYKGHYRGEKASYDMFDRQGLSRFSLHRILTEDQKDWLKGLIDQSDCKQIK